MSQANLLSNNGFETGDVAPWQVWGGFAVSNDANSGQYAAQANAYSGGGYFVEVTPGEQYVWRGIGKTTGSGWAGLRYRYYDAGWAPVGEYQQLTGFAAAFAEQSATIDVPAGVARIQLSVWNGDSGVLTVDDLSFALADAGGGDNGGGDNGGNDGSGDDGSNNGGGTGDNLLSNPGLESGNREPWQVWGTVDVVDDGTVQTGSYALRVPAYNGGGTFVLVNPGQATRFSAAGWVDGEASGAVLQVKLFDTNWQEIGQMATSESFPGGNYARRSVDVTVPTGVARLQLSFWNGSGTTLYLDNFEFVELTGGGDDSGGDNGGGDDGGNDGGDSGGGDSGGSNDGNLAFNGDFETGDLQGWQNWGGLSVVPGSAAGNGSWVGQISSDSGGGLIVDVQPQQQLSYSASGRSDQSGAAMFVKFFDAAWQQVGDEDYAPAFGAAWSPRTGQIAVPASATRMQIGFWNAGASVLEIDNVSVTSAAGGGNTDSGNSDDDPTNLIGNGSFESGNIDPWEGWSTITAVQGADAVDGNWYLQVAGGQGGGLAVPVVPGLNYRFAGSGRINATGGWAGLQYRFFDASWNAIGDLVRSTGFSQDWQENELSFTAPAGAVRVQVSVWNNASGDMDVDALSVRLDDNGGGPLIFYVSPNGSGVSTVRDAPGDVSATVAMICDAGATGIRAGDAIHFLDGVYLTSDFRMSYGADSDQAGHGGRGVTMLDRNCGGSDYIYLQAENRHGAVIRNDVGSQNHSGGFDIRRSSWIWIEGFVIEGLNDPNVPFERGVNIEADSHHIVVRDNRLLNIGGGAVVGTGSTHIKIERNEIRNAAGQHPYCGSAINFYQLSNQQGFSDDVDGYSNYIIANRVFNTATLPSCDANADPSDGIESHDGNCIVLDLLNQTQYTSNSTLIESNLCVGNDGGGVHMFESSNVDVFNNTIFETGRKHYEGGLGIACTTWPTQNVRFANNLVHAFPPATQFGGHVLVATDWGNGCLSNIEHRHNVFVNRDPVPSDIASVAVNLTTDITALADCNSTANLVGVSTGAVGWVNPSTDPDLADFSLASDSALAVDRASCSLTPRQPLDAAGLNRLQGAQHDLGAFERP